MQIQDTGCKIIAILVAYKMPLCNICGKTIITNFAESYSAGNMFLPGASCILHLGACVVYPVSDLRFDVTGFVSRVQSVTFFYIWTLCEREVEGEVAPTAIGIIPLPNTISLKNFVVLL
nr:hypothetical protein [Desulfobacterales bacterium]